MHERKALITVTSARGDLL